MSEEAVGRKQPSIVKVVHCLHCGKRQRRHMRTGRWFSCRYCKELNPGPELVESMNRAARSGVGLAKKAPGDTSRKAESRVKPRKELEEPAEPPPPTPEPTKETPAPVKVARVRRAAGAKGGPTPKRPSGGASNPPAAPSDEPEQPKKSWLDRVMYG